MRMVQSRYDFDIEFLATRDRIHLEKSFDALGLVQ